MSTSDSHPYYSIPLAADILDRFLPEFYDLADAVRIKAEVLHAILCHHREEDPLTLEAGVVRVADALDMERGRSRIPYEQRRPRYRHRFQPAPSRRST